MKVELKAISIEPTNHCNLKCNGCYAQEKKSLRKKGFMKWSLYEKLINECSEIGIVGVALNFAGEPTLHKDFGRMLEYATEKGISISFNTNGNKMDESLMETILKSNTTRVNFSLDGIGEKHEERRKGSNFEIVENNILKLKSITKGKKRFLISTSMVVSDQDIQEVKQFIKYWKDKNILPSIRTFIEDMSFVINTDIMYSTPSKVCIRGLRNKAVLWDGSFTYCCSDLNGELAFGNLNIQSIKEIWESEFMKYERKKMLRKADFYESDICFNCNLWKQNNYLKEEFMRSASECEL